MTEFPLSNRVVETFTTGGTGTVSLLGAVTNFVTAVSGLGDGNAGFFYAEGNSGGADAGSWEFFYGTVTAGSPDTLSRTTILRSSNSDAAVNWTAGATKTVFNTIPAELMNDLLATHKGSSRPAWLKAGGIWLDDSAASNSPPGDWLLKMYDGTDDIVMAAVDPTGNEIWPYFGDAQNLPKFLAYNSASDSNVTGAGTTATVDFDAGPFDIGGNFAADTFTAPLTGKYQLATQVRLADLASATTVQVDIVTSNRTYRKVIDSPADGDLTVSMSVLADMDTNDTAQVQVVVSGMGGDTVDILGSSVLITFFSGHLVP